LVPEPAQAPPTPRPGGKLGVIIDRLAAKTGATADELVAATGWQRHSVLWALSRLRARGFAMQLDASDDRKAYRLDVTAKLAALEFSAIKLMRAGRFETAWSDQRRQLGFD
jgi:hypothetical protein